MTINGRSIYTMAQLMKEFKWSSEECQNLLCNGKLLDWLVSHGHHTIADKMAGPLSRGEIDTALSFLVEEWLYQEKNVFVDLIPGKETDNLLGTMSMHVHGFISPEAARISDLGEKKRRFVTHWVEEVCELNRHNYSPGEPLIQVWWRANRSTTPYKLLDGEDGDYINRLYPLEPPICVVDYFDRVYKMSRACNGCMIPYGLLKGLSDGDRIEIIWPMTVYNPTNRVMGLIPPETKNILTRMVITLDQSSAGFGRRYKDYRQTLNTALGELPMTGPLLGVGRKEVE